MPPKFVNTSLIIRFFKFVNLFCLAVFELKISPLRRKEKKAPPAAIRRGWWLKFVNFVKMWR
jgi:hypothetical protein